MDNRDRAQRDVAIERGGNEAGRDELPEDKCERSGAIRTEREDDEAGAKATWRCMMFRSFVAKLASPQPPPAPL